MARGAHPDATVTILCKEVPSDLKWGVYTTEELIAVFSAPAGYLLDLIEADGEVRVLKTGEKIKVREDMERSSHPPVGGSS